MWHCAFLRILCNWNTWWWPSMPKHVVLSVGMTWIMTMGGGLTMPLLCVSWNVDFFIFSVFTRPKYSFREYLYFWFALFKAVMLLGRNSTRAAFAPLHSLNYLYGIKYGIIEIQGCDWRNVFCFKITKLHYRQQNVICCSAWGGTTVSETKHLHLDIPSCFRIIKEQNPLTYLYFYYLFRQVKGHN